MKLEQNENTYKGHLGWFGHCETITNEKMQDCVDIKLSDMVGIEKVAKVYQFASNGSSSSWNSGADEMFQGFTSLECGKAYYVVLKPGTGSVEIPHFFPSFKDVEQYRVLAKQCGATTTDPTPTPNVVATPTPTPENKNVKKIKMPVILLGFADFTFTTKTLEKQGKLTYTAIDNLFNGKDYSNPYYGKGVDDKPTGSIKSYYDSISFGQVDCEFDIIPAGNNFNPTDDNPNSYAFISQYSHKDTRVLYNRRVNGKFRENLLAPAYKKAIENLKKQGRDYNKEFGSNQVIFMHACKGAEYGGYDTIHSHKWVFMHEGRWINYNINPAIFPVGNKFAQSTMGVYAHESMHSFGLPDLYDYSGYGNGAGRLSVMASGSWGGALYGNNPEVPSWPTSWAREHFVKAVKVDADIKEFTPSTTKQTIKVYPAQMKNQIIKIMSPISSDIWYVEYRKRLVSGNNGYNWDRNQGYHALFKFALSNEDEMDGLAIWHASEYNPTGRVNTSDHGNGVIPPHSRSETGFKVSQEQADGRFVYMAGSTGYYDDLFVTGDEFTPWSMPSTSTRMGKPTGIKITNIKKTSDGAYSFDLQRVLEPSAKILGVEGLGRGIGQIKQMNMIVGRTYELKIKTQNIADGTEFLLKVDNIPLNLPEKIIVNGNVATAKIPVNLIRSNSKILKKPRAVTHFNFCVKTTSYASTTPFGWTEVIKLR